MLNLGGCLNTMSEKLNKESVDEFYNGHTLKGIGKSVLSGVIDGVTNGLIINGVMLTACGIITIINSSKDETE
jgi:hypothetical protein